MANLMRQHREKMLAEKQIRNSQSLDPWAVIGRAKLGGGQATVHVGMDLAAGSDSTTEVAVRLASALDRGEPTMRELDPTRQIELRLWGHMQQLKDFKSKQTKAALKKEWLPEFEGYIEGCLANSPAEQNDALVTLMIWALDAEDFALATRIARYAVLNDMVMPEGWTRTIAEVVTENAAEAFIANPEMAASQHEVIRDIIDLGRGEDFADELRAKIFKALGLALRQFQPAEAIEAFNQAFKLDKNCGVRNFIKETERAMKGGADTESTLDASGSQDVASEAGAPAATDTTTPETTATKSAE